ncbi:MAG TPA: patatin-like phospholipase family protein [Actinomycetes bacterium]|jgi:NTE family protein|nr:patatin-like phospholipase family protein [Actinomycetes bacterium]
MNGRALVLGGGGVTGIAWELGILKGLLDGGVDLSGADLIVGTSAGSVVGSQVTTARELDELVAAQRPSEPAARELGAAFDLEQLAAAFAELIQGAQSPREVRARIGAMALSAATVPEAERLAVIESALPRHDWPDRRLLITAVDTATGDPAVWDRDSGIPLVLAVAASCAVPGVWPPMTINGHRYMDGGVRSGTNLDLAAGHEVVVILAPIVGSLAGSLDDEITSLGPEAKVVVIAPDDATLEAVGPNPLDPSRRGPALAAGLAQAATFLDVVHDVWTSRQ